MFLSQWTLPDVKLAEVTLHQVVNHGCNDRVVIYRGSKIAAANAEQLRESKNVRQNKGQALKKRKAENVHRKKVAHKRKIKKKASPVRLILILILIGMLAGGAMFGLQFVEGGLG